MLNILITQFLINFTSYARLSSDSKYDGLYGSHPYIGMLIFFAPWILCILVSIYWTVMWHGINPRYIFSYFKSLSEERKNILYNRFKFYGKLSTVKKKTFEKRVSRFLINKNIFTEKPDELTEEMRVLIAASCVQLTLGLYPNYLSYFTSIKVVTDGADWKKAINSNKQIIVPWHEFMRGYNVSDDGYNPGLEIMATAISIEQRIGKKSGYIFSDTAYRVWKQKSQKHAEALIRLGVTQYKNYKEVNKDEYFAVSVVSFFEQPENFKARFPDLYDCMARLLNQNPLKYK